ncbi:hypothetical protein BJX65DRAFT_315134 [Aspergillus insuetus]
MSESTFGFMSQVFFVDGLSGQKPKRPRVQFHTTSRSHAARVAHEKRKAVKASKASKQVQLVPKMDEPKRRELQGAVIRYNSKLADIPISIKIFWNVVVPGVKPLFTLFNTRCVTSEEWLPYMAQDVFFHAGAAAMHAAHDQLVNPEFRTRPSQIIYEHRGRAMAALRTHLARGGEMNDAVLITVCFLALLERRFDEIEAHHTHKRILGTLVAARGGLDALSPYIKSVLMQYEFPWAMETGSSVLPRTQRRQPLYPSVHSPELLIKQIRRLPDGFAILALQGKLSTHLLSILERFIQFESGELGLDGNGPESSYMFDDFWDTFPQLSLCDTDEPSVFGSGTFVAKKNIK